MSLRPFAPRMFPASVTVYNDTYGQGVTGATTRTPGTGVPLKANVQLANNSTDKIERTHDDSGNAAGGRTAYDVSFPSDPGVKTDDTIIYGAITLICIGPAVPVFPFALFRVRCESRT